MISQSLFLFYCSLFTCWHKIVEHLHWWPRHYAEHFVLSRCSNLIPVLLLSPPLLPLFPPWPLLASSYHCSGLPISKSGSPRLKSSLQPEVYISMQKTRFNYIISSLSPKFAMEVGNLLFKPPAETPTTNSRQNSSRVLQHPSNASSSNSSVERISVIANLHSLSPKNATTSWRQAWHISWHKLLPQIVVSATPTSQSPNNFHLQWCLYGPQ